MHRLLAISTGLCLVLTSACNLYFGSHDNPDDPCEYTDDYGKGAPSTQEAPPSLRDPASGVCQTFDWYPRPTPPSSCVDFGHSEPDTADGESAADRLPIPTWGACESSCTPLGEEACLATPGCRGIYGVAPNDALVFQECWATDQQQSSSQECEGADAWTCSTMDACIAIHQVICRYEGDREAPLPDECDNGQFSYCANEPVSQTECTRDEECPNGYYCDLGGWGQPEPGPCPPDLGCDPIPPQGICVPEAPRTCYGDGDCLAGEHCEVSDECQSDPGFQCPEGADCAPRPGCGICVPDEPPPPLACETVSSESTCVRRLDCSPYYIGINCDCPGTDAPETSECTCEDWQYDSCHTNP